MPMLRGDAVEVVLDIFGVAFGDVESYGDRFLAVYAVRWRLPRCELPGLVPAHDAVEVGVHVGVFGRVELAFNGREVLDSEAVVRHGSGSVG